MGDHLLARPGDVARAHVLVVDDDDDLRDVLRDVLEEAGYRVHTAADGRDALERLLGGPTPDLILLDLLMPEMDGPALLLKLAATPPLSSIPVLATSASYDRFDRSPMCAAYIRKPFSSQYLIEIIERLLAPTPADVGRCAAAEG